MRASRLWLPALGLLVLLIVCLRLSQPPADCTDTSRPLLQDREARPRAQAAPPGLRTNGTERARPSSASSTEAVPTGPALVVRSVRRADGGRVEDVRIAVRHGQASWSPTDEEWSAEAAPLRIPRRGVRELALCTTDGAWWSSGPLDPEATTTVTFDVALAVPLELRGQVLCQDGRTPVTDAVVEILEAPAVMDVFFLDATAATEERGRFVFAGLPPGTYTIEACANAVGEGTPVRRTVTCPGSPATLELGPQHTLTIRILDEEGRLPSVSGQIEDVIGLESLPVDGSGPRRWHLSANPMPVAFDDEEAPRLRAFGDGYLPTDFHQPVWPAGRRDAVLELVLRRDPRGTQAVVLDLSFRGGAVPARVYLRRVVSAAQAAVNGAERAPVDGRIPLRVPAGGVTRWSLEPMTRDGHLASHVPFHPTENPWARQDFLIDPAAGDRVELVFEQQGGVHLDLAIAQSQSVWATLESGAAHHRVYFRTRKQDAGVHHPVSPPLPPGRWRMRFDREDFPGIVDVDIRAGELSRIPGTLCLDPPGEDAPR